MDIFTRLIDWIKLPTKYLFGISLLTGIILFLKPDLAANFGLFDFREKYRIWISLVFLASAIFFLINISILSSKWLYKSYLSFRSNRLAVHRMQNLTDKEKEILSFYIKNAVRTQPLEFNDGTVGELETFQIIYRPSTLSKHGEYFDYNIQPYAWNYLNKNKELLELNKPKD